MKDFKVPKIPQIPEIKARMSRVFCRHNRSKNVGPLTRLKDPNPANAEFAIEESLLVQSVQHSDRIKPHMRKQMTEYMRSFVTQVDKTSSIFKCFSHKNRWNVSQI